MIDEILGFHEPVIAYGQEAPSRISRTSSWDSSNSFLCFTLYPQTRIMANVQMKPSRKANTAAR